MALQQLTNRLGYLAKDAATAKQQAHDVKGYQRQRIAVEHLVSPRQDGAAPNSDVPVWLKLVGAVGDVVVAGMAILGIVRNLAIKTVDASTELQGRFRAQTTAALTSVVNRLQAAEAKQVQIETTPSTVTTLCTQRQQDLADRVMALELASGQGPSALRSLRRLLPGCC